jgi:hypothetical protein
MSPQLIAMACLFVVGIIIMGLVCAVLAIGDTLCKRMAEKELNDAGFESDGFIHTDEDGVKWLVGYKKD